MLRYIAIGWDLRSADGKVRAGRAVGCLTSWRPEFRCALATRGLLVYVASGSQSSDRVYSLGEKAGIVLGKLFRRNSQDRVGIIASSEAERICGTSGQHLISAYWGRYVALIMDSRGGRPVVLRDPTGGVNCLRITLPDLEVLCSHFGDCLGTGLVRPTINWDHLTRFLWFDRLVTSETGVVGVQHVQAGELLRLGTKETDRTFGWRPDTIHGKRTLDHPTQAMVELRDTVQHCVSSWGRSYGRILHELSGGLDSSVVLACLSCSSTCRNIVAQNFYTRTPEGDERRFARAAAECAGVELIESLLESNNQPFDRIFDRTPVPTPAMTHLTLENLSETEALVAEKGIDAIFSGQGGDHLFQRLKTPLIAAEFISRQGMREGWLSVLLETAQLTRKSIWSILGNAIAFGPCGLKFNPYGTRVKPSPLLSDASRDLISMKQVSHPWVDLARDLPAVKRLQIVSIIDSQTFYSQPYPGADTIHPLISQPIIELCLQIPSYVLTYGGIDRRLLREAFKDLIPPIVMQRTAKGGTTEYVCRFLIENLARVREMLLDGALMTNQILDRRATDTSLTVARLTRDSALILPVISSLRAEAWLTNMTGMERWQDA